MRKSHLSRNSLWHTPSAKRTVHALSRKFRIDSDDILIMLWDYAKKPKMFAYVENGHSVVRTKHFLLVQHLIASRLTGDGESETFPVQKHTKLIYKPFDFASIGVNHHMISHITKEEVLRMHKELSADLETLDDPISPTGLREAGLLDSALFHPQTSYDGNSKYSTVETVAAALMYAISHNHAFHNGNKRTAIVAMLVFLNRHNICLTCDEDDLFKISLAVADHRMVSAEYQYSDAEIFELARWIQNNSRLMTKGERPITLRKFRHLLANLGCEVSEGRVTRTVTATGIFGLRKPKILYSRKNIPDTMSDGSEVSPILIKAIRQDLELDPEHGVDSDTFYARTEFTSSEFIIKYSNLLRRLARV